MSSMLRLFIAATLLYAPLVLADAAEKSSSCNACHASAANQNAIQPALAGQHKDYLAKQLLQFQTGERGAAAHDTQGQIMAAVARTLSTEDIEILSTYYSALPAVTPAAQTADTALLDQGRRLYIGSCGACHGAKAEGNPALKSPALLPLHPDYLVLQLQHFQKGSRGATKTDKPGRQMAMMSRTLTEADMRAVAAYIGAGLP